MTVVELVTENCKIPGCDEEAVPARGGPYKGLCQIHKSEAVKRQNEAVRRGMAARKARGEPMGGQAAGADPGPTRDGFEKKARTLVAVGRRLDTAVKRFRPAKDDLDEAMREWKAAVARIAGGES